MENKNDYACDMMNDCVEECFRKSIQWKSPKWFGGWVTGDPGLGRDCPERIMTNNAMSNYMEQMARMYGKNG